MRLGLYLRCSTTLQEDSPAVQEAQLREYCTRTGHTVTYVFADEGVSGGTSIEHRPAFKALLAEFKAGRIEAILVLKVDRLSRDLYDFLGFLKAAQRHKLPILFATENYDDSASGRMMMQLTAMFAEHERRATGERVKAHNRHLAQMGRWPAGRPPMGYSYDKTTKTIEVDTNRAADAIAVFETFIATNGNRRLSSERLNAAGVLTRDGNLWSEDVIADFIRNPLYQGIIKYEDIETFVQIPEVVPLKLVSSAVALCQPGRPRERSSKRLYVYSGLLVCGDCGRTLKVHTTNRVSSWAYVCRGRKDYGVCRGRSIGSGRIDRLVGIGLETALSAARDSLLRLAEESAQDATTEAQEQAFARRHANLQESRAKTVDLYVAGIISREDMEHRVGEIDRQLKECDKPKEKPPVFTADMLSGMLVKWPEKWVAMDAADKRALVLNTCSRVVVKPESIVLDTNLPCGLVTVDE